MLRVIADVKFREEIVLDGTNVNVDLRQAFVNKGIIEIGERFLVVTEDNKITKSNIYVPLTNVTSIKIHEVLKGNIDELRNN